MSSTSIQCTCILVIVLRYSKSEESSEARVSFMPFISRISALLPLLPISSSTCCEGTEGGGEKEECAHKYERARETS